MLNNDLIDKTWIIIGQLVDEKASCYSPETVLRVQAETILRVGVEVGRPKSPPFEVIEADFYFCHLQ